MALECQFCENLPIKPIKTKKKQQQTFSSSSVLKFHKMEVLFHEGIIFLVTFYAFIHLITDQLLGAEHWICGREMAGNSSCSRKLPRGEVQTLN